MLFFHYWHQLASRNHHFTTIPARDGITFHAIFSLKMFLLRQSAVFVSPRAIPCTECNQFLFILAERWKPIWLFWLFGERTWSTRVLIMICQCACKKHGDMVSVVVFFVHFSLSLVGETPLTRQPGSIFRSRRVPILLHTHPLASPPACQPHAEWENTCPTHHTQTQISLTRSGRSKKQVKISFRQFN